MEEQLDVFSSANVHLESLMRSTQTGSTRSIWCPVLGCQVLPPPGKVETQKKNSNARRRCLLLSDRFLPVCTQARQVLSNSVSNIFWAFAGYCWQDFQVSTWCEVSNASGTHGIVVEYLHATCIWQLKFRCGSHLADLLVAP